MRSLTKSLVLPFTLATAALPALADDGVRESGRKSRRTPVVEAVEKAAPAVVSIGTTQKVKFRYWDWDFLQQRTGEQEQRGLGSGVIVHPSGYVVTNAHVINEADEILVKLTGSRESEPEVRATIVATDLDHDLSLLRLEKPGPYPYVEFGRSDDLMLGETVIAIGNPFGLGRTVTTGIVSALDRTINVKDSSFRGLIQTDAAVNRGNSGGPLVNINGEWIGVNSAIYSLSGGADGISFAIPSDVVRKFLVSSLRTARFSGRWLGLEFGEDAEGRPVVERVYPMGAAARAGVPARAAVMGYTDSLRLCFDLLDGARRGTFAFAVKDRAGRPQSVTLAFEAPPTDEMAWRRLGVRAVPVDDAVAKRTGYRVGSGLVVTEIKEGGSAQRIGLERGDLLTTLGARRLGDADDLLGEMLLTRDGEARDLALMRPMRNRLETWKARIVLE